MRKEEPEEYVEYCNLLPYEIKLEILKHLSVSEILKLSTVSKTCWKLIQDDCLWEYLAKRDYTNLCVGWGGKPIQPKFKWKEIVKRLKELKEKKCAAECECPLCGTMIKKLSPKKADPIVCGSCGFWMYYDWCRCGQLCALKEEPGVCSSLACDYGNMCRDCTVVCKCGTSAVCKACAQSKARCSK